MTSTTSEEGTNTVLDGQNDRDSDLGQSHSLTPDLFVRQHDPESRSLSEELRRTEDEAFDQEDEIENDYFGNHANYQQANANNGTESLSPKAGPQEEQDDLISNPDDTPSIQGSPPSSRSSIVSQSIRQHSPNFSPSSKPFDRRFTARRTSSQILGFRAASPGFLTTHSRQSSLSSQLSTNSKDDTLEQDARPWEVIRWTKLRKISSQAFSEAGKRAFGSPSFLTVGPLIAIGTSKGIILLFDYQQTLKSIIGQGTAAAECGGISSLAISADHSTIVAGHSEGTIFTWEISRPAQPFLHIQPIAKTTLRDANTTGHVAGCAVIHVGFLGTRRTALVSADDSGMAFSHLASRGLGALGRTITTTRLLGRYVDPKNPSATKKPSSVLAFSPLPLGNVERTTDEMGLTALLSPYLLVIVSTTPFAQTQFKLPRTKETAAHGAMTGCLAWFPAVKIKEQINSIELESSRTKLAYCWSNVLSVLEVEESLTQVSDQDQARIPARPKANLQFHTRGSWKSEESIAAVQWLSRSILAVLTITQRLIVLEDKTMHVADTSDLNSKHIYHQDLFSRQLLPVVDKVDHQDPTMHGIIPDAYNMSFKAYKSRLFLLGMSDLSMGIMSNWADRLIALMGKGDYIAAIDLATKYYEGDTDKLIVGLPEDNSARHFIVKEKILDILNASLKYIFSDERNDDTENDLRTNLSALAAPAFRACFSMDTLDYIFETLFEWYSDASSQDIFLYNLEDYVNDGRIRNIPSVVLKDMMNWYGALGMGTRLEDMICSLQTDNMDIDQVMSLCKKYNLYDAYIYVSTQALSDFITPVIELLFLVTNSRTSDHDRAREFPDTNEISTRLFPYLTYVLTNRVYPVGSEMKQQQSTHAKSSLYGFIFSSGVITWPPHDGKVVQNKTISEHSYSAYPYLQMFLEFDTPSFISVLNEAFEDSFLNGSAELQLNGSSHGTTGSFFLSSSMNRQRIVNILIELLTASSLANYNKTYIDMFIARNLPKFPQFVQLPGSKLRAILIELCNYPQGDLAEECQLSAEYLLSIYHPTDLHQLIPLFEKAGFFRILKSTYRGNKQYAKWLDTFFEDPDNKQEVFNCLGDCLRPLAGLTSRQSRDVVTVLMEHGPALVNINVTKTAMSVLEFIPEKLDQFLEKLGGNSQSIFEFLEALFEPGLHDVDLPQPIPEQFRQARTELYVELMCKYRRHHVADYVNSLDSGNLHLDQILPIMESNGVIDAAVILMAKDGLVSDAMFRLLDHLKSLNTALIGLLDTGKESREETETDEAENDLLAAITKYTKVGIWLCQGASRKMGHSHFLQHNGSNKSNPAEDELTREELLWVNLIDAVVQISRSITEVQLHQSGVTEEEIVDLVENNTKSEAAKVVRMIVQDILTALLASTTKVMSVTLKPITKHDSMDGERVTSSESPAQGDVRNFLRIFRAFLSRAAASSPSLRDLRKILTDIFDTYAFEESLLSLTNEFMDKDMFIKIAEANKKRSAGWRPKSQICEGCRRRAWGPSAGQDVWEAWRARQATEAQQRLKKWNIRQNDSNHDGQNKSRGKGKGKVVETTIKDTAIGAGNNIEALDGLVVFACMHLWHRKCLERAGNIRKTDAGVDYKCALCS